MDERAFRHYSAYAAAVFVAGMGIFVWALSRGPLPLHVGVLLLVIAVMVAENAAIVLPKGFVTSLAYPLSLAANILFGPAIAGLVALCSAINVDDIRERINPVVVAFNVGQVVLAHTASGLLYVSVGGRVLWSESMVTPFAPSEFPAMLLPLIAVGLSASALNAALVGIGIAIKYSVRIRSVWREHLRAFFPIQLSLSVVAVSIAQVMAVQVAGLVLFVFPLLVSRQVYQRYVALRRFYVDTVRSLVAALEAKDRYTAGHSERVAQYSVAIAKAMGLPDETVERIDLAAQLHDLGKVGISGEVLSKPGRLTSEEFEAIRAHPEVGANLVARVPGLTHIVPIVRHHHERYDGGGYCAGLAGDEIPLEARIMAVADAFDAMTSSRAYRAPMTLEAAVTEVRECAGSQFDPDVVEHMLRSSIVDGEVGTE